MTRMESEHCTECGRRYLDKSCGPTHAEIKHKIQEAYGDKSWPPSTMETK